MTDDITFKDLGIEQELLAAIEKVGYETPSPIQAKSIPVLLNGDDLMAQAQTGTGKTAAFALPILNNIDLSVKATQALIIAPTRELAIQVAEAFQSYSRYLDGFHVAPIYGGQDYEKQIRALKRGCHVIVGTPGRLMDHMRRQSLNLNNLKTIVLDEADEMLKMGFIEDIEWILEQIKQPHQTALFSATIPSSIKKVADKYIKNAKTITIKAKEKSITNIQQFFMYANRNQKIEALTRYLEIEDLKAAIIFVRTRTISSEISEKLQARGYAAAALNGDMSQSMREKTISRIKKGTLDIIVATDVAARGIDVDRISHVINYDIPHDIDSYIHRIGRTGRAGRTGKALLFVSRRENRLLEDIERAVGQPIKEARPPSIKQMQQRRNEMLLEKISNIVNKSKHLAPYQETCKNIIAESELPAKDIAAALMYLLDQAKPLPTDEIQPAREEPRRRSRGRNEGGRQRTRSSRPGNRSDKRSGERDGKKPSRKAKPGAGKRKPTKGGKPKKHK